MQDRESVKQPYEPPLLIVEGDMSQITAGGIIAVADIDLAGTQ